MFNAILLIVLIWGIYSHVQVKRRIELHLEEIKYNLRERMKK